MGLLEWISNGVRERVRVYEVWRGTLREERWLVGGVVFGAQRFEYDGAGKLTHFWDTEGGLHEWGYDEAERLREIRYGGREVARLTYGTGVRLRETGMRDGTGAPMARTFHRYDGLGRRVRQVTVREGTGEVVCDLGWGYDEGDRVRRMEWRHVGAEVGIEYDERDQVTRERLSGNGGEREAPAYENELGGAGTGVESEPGGPAAGRRMRAAVEEKVWKLEATYWTVWAVDKGATLASFATGAGALQVAFKEAGRRCWWGSRPGA